MEEIDKSSEEEDKEGFNFIQESMDSDDEEEDEEDEEDEEVPN